jgi:hypothetical protein
MNRNRRVLLFVTGTAMIYFLVSLFATIYSLPYPLLKRINLISDIVTLDSNDIAGQEADSNVISIVPDKMGARDFNLYKQAHTFTAFHTDSTNPALFGFCKKLYALKMAKKGKVRVAYFGDSMIEGDLLTQTIRKMMQHEFGGTGVGFVPITSQVSSFRQTVSTNHSETWTDQNFKTEGIDKSHLFLSGHQFRTSNGWVEMKNAVVSDSNALLEKTLFCGYSQKPLVLSVNNVLMNVNAPKPFNRILIANDRSPFVRLSVSDEELPVYGISIESEKGIVVDNFSFRGISGIEFSKIDAEFLKSIAENNSYDLIVFQYGLNVLYKPNDNNFNWYARSLSPIVKKFKRCFPSSDFLMVGTADRAFKYGDRYKSAIGIDSLIKVQAKIAYENNCGFYNLFATMGGQNTITDWATRTPPLAGKDFVHPNKQGAQILGGYFFDALMLDYHKFVKNQHK